MFLVYAPALAGLVALAEASPVRAAVALLAGEVSARSAMLLTLAFGKPAEHGSSSVPFVRAIKGRRRMAGTALALLVPLPFLLPVGGLAPLAVLAVPLTVLVVLPVARRAFGGIGGDVVGTAGEATRTVLLVVLSGVM